MLCDIAVTVLLAVWTLMAETCAFQPSQMQVNNFKMQTRMSLDFEAFNKSIYNSNGSQHCSIDCNAIRHLNGILSCFSNKSQGTGLEQPHLFVGYCISCKPHSYRDKSEILIAECPFSLGKNTKTASISLDKRLNFCSRFGRAGRLCGDCLTNYSINVMSDSFDCIECSDSPANWLKFFAVRLASLTVFFVIVVVFRIGVTQAPLNGFVFFSQIVSLRSYILMVEAGWNLAHHDGHNPITLARLLYYPYSVWSLNFISIDRLLLKDRFCLSRHLKVVHIIMLEYIIALYPLFLLGIVYILIELHDRNYRIFVCLWRLLCVVCVRIRRSFKYKSSLVDAFVTFLLLSYTKMAVVSFELVSSGPIVDITGKTVGKALRIDPSVSLTRYQVIAWIVIIIYGGCFPIFLLFYPSRHFRACLNKLCSPRLVQVLHTFADAFQGNYKCGQNGEPDRRFFAGIYLCFRMIIFYIMTFFSCNVQLYWLLLAYLILLLFFVAFQPYKVSHFNWLEASFVAILGIVALSLNYLRTSLQITQEITPKFDKLWKATYFVHFVPLLYIICYIVYWIMRNNKHCTNFHFHLKNRVQDAAQSEVPLDVNSEIPHRLTNPGDYAAYNTVNIAANTSLLESAQDSTYNQYGSLTETDHR